MQASNFSIENRLILSGKVSNGIKHSRSPAGISTYSFWLEHRSEQTEVGMKRQAWCKIKVVLAGNEFDTQAQNITVGRSVKVDGFIHSHKDYNGLNQLVLHANKIEFID